MRHQQGGRTSTEDVASWRQPDVAELPVLAQQVVVLGFANFHTYRCYCGGRGDGPSSKAQESEGSE